MSYSVCDGTLMVNLVLLSCVQGQVEERFVNFSSFTAPANASVRY